MSVVTEDESARTLVYEINQSIRTLTQAFSRAHQFQNEAVTRNANRCRRSLVELLEEVSVKRNEMLPGSDRERLDRTITRADNILVVNPEISLAQVFLGRTAIGQGGSDPGRGSLISRPIPAGPNRLARSVCSAGSSFDPNQTLRAFQNEPSVANARSFHTLSGLQSPSRQSSIIDPSNSASQVGDQTAVWV